VGSKPYYEDTDRLERLEAKGVGADRGERFGLQPKISGVCRTCTSSHIFERSYNNRVVVHCNALERDVPTDITRCNHYSKYGELTMYEMNNIATLIDVSPEVGFMVDRKGKE